MDFHCLSLCRALEFVIGSITSGLKKINSRALEVVTIQSNQIICFSV